MICDKCKKIMNEITKKSTTIVLEQVKYPDGRILGQRIESSPITIKDFFCNNKECEDYHKRFIPNIENVKVGL